MTQGRAADVGLFQRVAADSPSLHLARSRRREVRGRLQEAGLSSTANTRRGHEKNSGSSLIRENQHSYSLARPEVSEGRGVVKCSHALRKPQGVPLTLCELAAVTDKDLALA